MNIFIVRCALHGYIRPKSALVICCGLSAKWLRLGQGPGNALALLWSYKCGEHLRLRWFGSLSKYTTGYLWYHVTWLATSVPWIE